MSGRWWRAYDQAVDDPKLQRLAPPLFRAWFNLMCIASANGGTLPAIGDVAFKLHLAEHKAAEIITSLVAVGLLDRRSDGKFEPHNWNGRQFVSDVSTPRVKRFRERQRNGLEGGEAGVSATPPESETESDSESESEKESDPGTRASARYSREFDEQFWKPYPRTPVMSKAEAWRAWQKAGAAERAALVAAVPRYAAWLAAKPDHPAVHACRFITQRRFEGFDEAAGPAAPTLVAIAPGTPEWDAWWRYYAARKNGVGKSFGQTRMRQAREERKAHLERSRWPPGYAPPAEKPGDSPHE